MPRVKRGVTARARHKKVLDAGQGFPRPPQERLPHRQGSGDEGGAVCSTATAASKKREFRALWIARINAAVRELGMTYSVFIERPEEGGDRHRPQGAGRSRRARQGGV